MGLPQTGRRVAKRLIPLAQTKVDFVAITTTPGATEFDPPTTSETLTSVSAAVTGVSKWEVSETVVSSDKKVLVDGGLPIQDIGGIIKIAGRNHKIIDKLEILEGGYPSAVKYFVRRG